MFRHISRIFHTPWDPDITRSGQQSQNDNTYAFLVRIVKGADYQQPREVEVLALYNEACTCNFISGRFAKDQLEVRTNEPSDDGDCVLVWACEGLGRYEQRTVFWIAPDADFDILFGREDDFNNRSENSQFNCGIESGILSTEFPRREPPKSFQGGINDEFLLPVERSNPLDSTGRSRMPSLAEIKKQLAAQLESSPERKQKHERQRALNIFNPHYMLNRPNGEMTTQMVMPESSNDHILEETLIVRHTAVDLANGSVFKGNKRIHSAEHSALSMDINNCSKSPKLRDTRARSLSIHATLDQNLEHVPPVAMTAEKSLQLAQKPIAEITKCPPILEVMKPSLQASKKYQYEPLPRSNNIRLLKLMPGKSNEDMHCSLFFSVLPEEFQQSPCDFEALSYTWGSNELLHKVLMNDLEFPVTSNLFEALRENQLSNQVRIIWVDAICINQDDICERRDQVEKIPQILRASKNVLFWPRERAEGMAAFQKNQGAKTDVNNGSEEILFSCMDGGYSPRRVVSSDGSSISLSPQEPVIIENVIPPIKTFHQVPSTKKPRKKTKRKRKTKAKISGSAAEPSWADKFNEFWTKDEEANNWYHDDKITKKRIWYNPPPIYPST